MTSSLQAGDRIWLPRDADELPDGARVAAYRTVSGAGVKHNGRWYTDNLGGQGMETDFDFANNPGYYWLLASPGEPPLSLPRYKFAVREVIVVGARNMGVGDRELDEAIRELGLEAENFPLGDGVRIANSRDLARVPNGSLLQSGHPDLFDHFGIFHVLGSAMQPVLGGRTTYDQHEQFRILRYGPGGSATPDWWAQAADELDVEAVRRFRARVWRVAAAAKERHDWCSQLETTFLSIGVSLNDLMVQSYGGIHVGSFVDATQARGLPIGTILRWRHSGYPFTRVCWLSVNAEHQTRILFGYRDDEGALRHYYDRMEVMAFPLARGHYELDVDFQRAFSHLPPGTVFKQMGPGTKYVMGTNQLAIEVTRGGDAGTPPGPGRMRSQDFGGGNAWFVCRFPGVPTRPVDGDVQPDPDPTVVERALLDNVLNTANATVSNSTLTVNF